MTKENQEKQNGRTEGGSGKNANRRNNDRRKNNTSFKRVNLERKRPQLTKDGTAQGKPVRAGAAHGVPRRGVPDGGAQRRRRDRPAVQQVLHRRHGQRCVRGVAKIGRAALPGVQLK